MASMDKVFAGYAARQAVLESTESTNPFWKGIAWVVGRLVPLAEARIPFLDQGFLHSDLTYVVPSIWDGRFFRLDDHITRLEASCTKLRLQLPLLRDQVKQILVNMVAKSGIHDAFVELIVTRGLKGVRGTRPEDITNNLYMLCSPPSSPERCVVCPLGAIDSTVKNLQWGDLVCGMFEAADRGANYPFLTDGDEHITEGSGFNIVVVKDGALYMPDRGVLQGVTRKSVINVAEALGVEVRVEFVPVELAYNCDEIFMCMTAGGIMPITTLDGIAVNGGQVGPITKKIWDGYWDMRHDAAYSFEIDHNERN